MTQLLRLTDTTLRDGSHAIHYSFTIEQVHTIVKGLDEAGIPVIEASHGAGLAGSTIQQGFSTVPEFDLLAEALRTAKRAKIAVLLVPGIGTTKELLRAAAMGLHIVRIAVHCTEADISQQHFEAAKKAGLEAVGFLMMAHSQPPAVLAEQAKLMESYGADCVYVVDSAGAMLPYEAAARVKALCEAISIPVGFHAHNNLGVAVGNTLAAIEAGASQVDGTLRSLGAGAGNAPTEVLVAALKKLGLAPDYDLFRLADLAEEVVAPLRPSQMIIDRDSLVLGYAGVYSSFLLHARHAAEKFGLDPREILIEMGQRQAIAGQEDWLLDVAVELAQKRSAARS
jgi:4-hydroxy 2-oxovalerate aldolase